MAIDDGYESEQGSWKPVHEIERNRLEYERQMKAIADRPAALEQWRARVEQNKQSKTEP